MKRIAASLAILCAAAAPAYAQSFNLGDLPYRGVPAFTAPGTDLSIDIRGRAYYDFADVDHSYPGPNQPGGAPDNDWRTIRLGADLSAGPFSATAEFNILRVSRVQPIDLTASFRAAEGVSITVGHFKEALTIDNLTSGRYTTFQERSSLVQAFDVTRRIGVRLGVNGSNWSWNTALQGDPMDGLRVSARSTSASSRVHFAPIVDSDNQRFIHVAGAVRYREAASTAPGDLFRYRSRPPTNWSDRVIDTQAIGESDITYGLEAGGGFGPFHFQAEYLHLNADDAVNGGSRQFNGGYVQVGYFITGEHRTYRANSGTFDRTSPRSQLGRGGFGALEVGGRFNWIDLNSGAFRGGDMTSWTVGATWYPTARTRIMLEYTDADVDSGQVRNLGDGSSKILQTRLQFDW